MNYETVDDILHDLRMGRMSARTALETAFKVGSAQAPTPKRVGMTAAQRDLLAFIMKASEASGGVCPSYEEMMEHMGLKSKSGIHRIILALEERGMIYRLPHRARSIGIVTRTAA